ncbi:MAG: glutamyl-tRNA reductase [Gammaproteobacteria bacterium]|nr:glutamyl-tRNA reductase [Gammaproteobacteria bacterium]
MDLFAFGINHTTAPVDVRERVGFAPERLPMALQDLVSQGGVSEAAILSTCNRTDLYCGLKDGSGDRAIEWFQDYHRLPATELRPYLYVHRAEHAVRHIIRVASGLDSMILGEPQILGQVKEAYRTAHASGTVGQLLSRLFQHTFSVAKQVRTDTAIGANPVSVAFAATTLARQIFGELNEQTALLVGAGETIELVARHLRKAGLTRLIIANRTVENAQKLASQFGGFAIGLDALEQHLGDADIVVSSTGAQRTVISTDYVRGALAARKRKPMFMCDIAVPRDIDADVSDFEDVYLFTVDDLQDVIQDNLRSRQEAALQAESIIDGQVTELMGWLGTRDAVPLIRGLRTQATLTRDEVLEKAMAQLASGKSPEQAIQFLANTLTNKLLHAPTCAIRAAGAEGREDVLDAAVSLFGISDTTHTPGDNADD